MKIGDPYTWTPECFFGQVRGTLGGREIARKAHGRVVYINHRHRFFLAEAQLNGHTIRECFKF